MPGLFSLEVFYQKPADPVNADHACAAGAGYGIMIPTDDEQLNNRAYQKPDCHDSEEG